MLVLQSLKFINELTSLTEPTHMQIKQIRLYSSLNKNSKTIVLTTCRQNSTTYLIKGSGLIKYDFWAGALV